MSIAYNRSPCQPLPEPPIHGRSPGAPRTSLPCNIPGVRIFAPLPPVTIAAQHLSPLGRPSRCLKDVRTHAYPRMIGKKICLTVSSEGILLGVAVGVLVGVAVGVLVGVLVGTSPTVTSTVVSVRA